jgi:hypothetical protein
MHNISNIDLPNYGFLTCDLNDFEFLPILKEVNEIQENFQSATKYNQYLLGNIEQEYKIEKSHDILEKIVVSLCYRYPNHRCSEYDEFYLAGSWINFQKKNEFNPPHFHDGEFSFVLYVKIPYSMEDEKNFNLVPKEKNVAGCFSFHYTDVLGRITPYVIPTDKNFEKKLILFPAKMIHEVYPFHSSDGYRISISGNVYKRNKKI